MLRKRTLYSLSSVYRSRISFRYIITRATKIHVQVTRFRTYFALRSHRGSILYCDRLSNDDKDLYCAGRSFNFGISPWSYILAARTSGPPLDYYYRHPRGTPRGKCRISYYPRDVTYPHPLFFISRRYKRNALLISRLLAIPPTRFFLLVFSFSRDQYRMIRTEHFINSARPFGICGFMLSLRIQENCLIYGFNIALTSRT